MKRFLAMFIALIVTTVPALSEVITDFSDYTDNQLKEMQEAISLELKSRTADKYDPWLPSGAGSNIPDPADVFERQIVEIREMYIADDHMFFVSVADVTTDEFELYVDALISWGYEPNGDRIGYSFDTKKGNVSVFVIRFGDKKTTFSVKVND